MGVSSKATIGRPLRGSYVTRVTEGSPVVRLAILDGFRLTLDGDVVHLSLGPKRLLAYLALHDHALPRARVAGVLWANVSEQRAAGNLRSAVWRIKQLGLALMSTAHESLSLNAAVVVDVREADRLAREVMEPTADLCAIVVDQSVFTAELLPGWYDEWIVLERERQRQIGLHALEVLCERWTAAGKYPEAVMAGLAAVAREPLRESAHRALIKTYLAEGNPGEAIRQYRLCCEMLRDELNLEPSPQIKSLLADYVEPRLAAAGAVSRS